MDIDINCDVGEGISNEYLLMPYISSCNIACGGHFGDINSIDKTVQLAIENNIKIGAHPSFPDKENFGRKLIHISDVDLKNSIQYQIELFLSRLSLFNVEMNHIKPHGALYNAVAKDERLANVLVDSIQKYAKNTFLFVPFGSEIEKVALKNDIKIKYEAFADRNYNDALTLVSRGQKNALLTNEQAVFEHTLLMVKYQKLKTISGLKKKIKADTFCVHSDTKNALKIVKYLHQNLTKEGFKIA